MSNARPNMLILFPDQLRVDAIGAYGCRAVTTPAMNSLAARGRRFTNAVSPTPICVPARASLMTGRGAGETGVTDNGAWLRPDRRQTGMDTWPEILAEAGYSTTGIGKMHFYPWDINEGFSTRVIAEDKRHIHIRDDYAVYLKDRGLRRLHGQEHPGYFENQGAILHGLPDELHVDRWVADRTIEYLKRTECDQPFAALVGFPGPHCPYDPPKDYLDEVDIDAFAEIIEDGSVEWMRRQAVDSNRRPWNGIDYTDFTIENRRKVRRHYLASVKHLDDQIGRILTCLEETGLVENTIVLLTSDHGDFLGDRGLVGKKYFFRQAVDVPLIMAGPGVTPGTDQTLRSLSDLFATVLDAAGVDESDLSDSRSLLAEGDVNRVVCGQLDIGLFCARENWRYSRYRGGEIRLYNITRDPEELINLAERDEACRTRSEMESALTEWMSESLYAAHRDKRVEARNDDPDSEFNRAGWVRPYPGRS